MSCTVESLLSEWHGQKTALVVEDYVWSRAFFISICKTAAVTWCAYLVFETCDACKNYRAVPDEATWGSPSKLHQPESSNQSAKTFLIALQLLQKRLNSQYSKQCCL